VSDSVLNAHDLGTETWRKIKEHFTERLQELREENDAPLPENETNKKRGRIAEAKYVLSLADKPIKLSRPASED
jgi:hypothetical protein